MIERFVLDAWAVLAWLGRETGAAERVRALLEDSAVGRIDLAISIVNAGEVYYVLARRAGPEAAEAFLRDLPGWPVRVVSAADDLVLEAARLKARYRLSYADAFAVATARALGARLLTGDPEIRTLGAIVEVEWLGPESP